MILKRLSGAVLAALMLLPLITACSNEPSDKVDVQDDTSVNIPSAPDTTIQEPVETSVKDIPDGLPEKVDYQGAKYTIMIVNEGHRLTYRFDLTAEEVADTLDQASYDRTATVEERFHVDIVTNPTGKGMGAEFTYLQQCAQAGDSDVIDLVQPNGNGYGQAATAVLNSLLMDFNDLDMIDFDKPWWDKEATDTMMLNGHRYVATGSITTTRDNAHAVIFNKKMMDDLGIAYPYETAAEGKWVVDDMMAMMTKATKDLNGDGKMDETDCYGMVTNQTFQANYQSYWGAGKVVKANKDGTLYVDYDAELIQNIAEKVLSMINSGSVYYFEGSENAKPFAMFQNGLGLFHVLGIGQNYAWLRDIADFDYGILPVPKYDEKQDNYSCFLNPGILCIFSMVENPERTGNVTEALAAETLKQVYDPFVKSMLYGKIAQDSRDVDMINIIWNSKCLELVRIYSTDTSFLNLVRTAVVNLSPEVQSSIASNLPVLEKTIKSFNKAFTAMQGN